MGRAQNGEDQLQLDPAVAQAKVPGTHFSGAEMVQYARNSLIALDLQPGQPVAILISNPDQIPLAIELAMQAEEQGSDFEIINPFYSMSNEEIADKADIIRDLASKGAKSISLTSGGGAGFRKHPEAILRDQEALDARRKSMGSLAEDFRALRHHSKRADVLCPTQAWADDIGVSLETLTQDCVAAGRANCTEEEFRAHLETLERRAGALTEAGFTHVRIEDEGGTSITFKVAERSRFSSVGYRGEDGKITYVNAQSDEVFFSPDHRSAEGKIVTQYPVDITSGNETFRIEKMEAVYEGGEMVSATAYNKDGSKDELATEFLKRELVGKPKGRFGEVGLCDGSSPLAQIAAERKKSGQAGGDFHLQHADEQAVICHAAIGSSYQDFTGGEDKAFQDDPGLHVDLGIGGPGSKIIGVKKEGEVVQESSIIEDDKWQGDFR